MADDAPMTKENKPSQDGGQSPQVGGFTGIGSAVGGGVGGAIGAVADIGLAVDSWLGARAAERAKKQQRKDMIITMEDAAQRAEASRRGMYDLLLTRLGSLAGSGAFGGKSPMDIFKADPRAGTGRHLPQYNSFMDSPEAILPSEDYYQNDMNKERRRYATYSWYKQYEDVHGPGAKPKEVPAYDPEAGEVDPGYKLYDDGTKEYPDGTREFPNGTRVDENGQTFGPDGKPLPNNQGPIYNSNAVGPSDVGPDVISRPARAPMPGPWDTYMSKPASK